MDRDGKEAGTTQITRLRLSNWRNFKSVDVPLGQRVFVVGPNASGKTNLLDALRFLRDIAIPEGSLVRAMKERRELKHLRSLHAGFNSNVAVGVDLVLGPSQEEWTYELEVAGTKSRERPLRIVRELVVRGGKEILKRPGPQDTNDLVLAETHLQQASQSVRFQELRAALASIVHVHVVPQVARNPRSSEELSVREAPGSDFIVQLARLGERQQRRALRRIEKLLRVAVPRFSELNVTRDAEGHPHLGAKYAHWRRRGGWQNEVEFSDGTLRLIGLLWAVDNGTSPILLEEPELSLHREVIRQLPRLFAAAAERNGRQVIVSTHAEEMVSDRGIDPSELLLLEPGEHETRVVVGSEKEALVAAARTKLPLGRVVTALTKPKDIDQLALDFARTR